MRSGFVRTLRFPHPLALLVGGVLLAGLATLVVPAGEFARALHPVTGRSVVVSGSYHLVPATPIGLLGALTAIPRGLIDAAEVIATVLLVGGAFTVFDRTGALRVGLVALVRALGGRAALAIPVCCAAFAAAGALENMQEEIIALVPVLVLFAGRFGASPVVAVAISLGAAAVGASFSPINPFQVVIAQQVADVAVFSGGLFRLGMLVVALGFWSTGVVRYARSHPVSRPRAAETPEPGAAPELDPVRTGLVIAVMLAAFAAFIIGLARFGWGFNELSGVFLVAGAVAGLVGGLGVSGTAEAYGAGFRDMALSGVLIGVSRAIFVVLADGHVVDTIVNGLFAPLAAWPPALAALGMLGVQAVTHVLVPSVSGQAVLTMPILAPLADLLHISRQVAVLAFQCGAGLCELITPTNGALMAVLVAAGVPFDRWLGLVLPLWAGLMALAAAAVWAAMAGGLT